MFDKLLVMFVKLVELALPRQISVIEYAVQVVIPIVEAVERPGDGPAKKAEALAALKSEILAKFPEAPPFLIDYLGALVIEGAVQVMAKFGGSFFATLTAKLEGSLAPTS